MKSPNLDRLIVIEEQSTQVDPMIGSQVYTWAPFASVRASKKESATSSERMEKSMGALASYARPTKFMTRYLPGVTTSMRINEDGKLFQIVGTAEVGRRMWLEIACMEFAHE